MYVTNIYVTIHIHTRLCNAYVLEPFCDLNDSSSKYGAHLIKIFS